MVYSCRSSTGRRDLEKLGHGLVFFFLRSNNPMWIPAILLSLKHQFPKSKVFLGNNVPAIKRCFRSLPEDLSELYGTVKADWLTGKCETLIDYDAHSGERFMAKVGLGIGALFLDPSFQDSSSAALLRQYFREADWKVRRRIPVEATCIFFSQSLTLRTLGFSKSKKRAPVIASGSLTPSASVSNLITRFFPGGNFNSTCSPRPGTRLIVRSWP